MNGITTIAALPAGGGCMASLPAEVGEQAPLTLDHGLLLGIFCAIYGFRPVQLDDHADSLAHARAFSEDRR